MSTYCIVDIFYEMANTTNTTTGDNDDERKNVLLVLHGNHQTGQLLSGRIARLTKRLQKELQIEAIYPDAPHTSTCTTTATATATTETATDKDPSQLLKTWWKRNHNNYVGLEESLSAIETTVHQVQHPQYYDGQKKKKKKTIVGILGFSQGARLAHLLSLLHHYQQQQQRQQENNNPEGDCRWFPNLKFIIFVAGYDHPILPPELASYIINDNKNSNNNNNNKKKNNEDDIEHHGTVEEELYVLQQQQLIPALSMHDNNNNNNDTGLTVSSLHIWGSKDALVTPDQSQVLSEHYHNGTSNTNNSNTSTTPTTIPTTIIKEMYIHPGKHHVPTKGSEMHVYVDFIRRVLAASTAAAAALTAASSSSSSIDEEVARLQQEELQALEMIYPDNDTIHVLSSLKSSTSASASASSDENDFVYDFPIVYRVNLNNMELDVTDSATSQDTNHINNTTTNWPKLPLTIEITYPFQYPSDTNTNTNDNDDDDAATVASSATSVPVFVLRHENTVLDFPSLMSEKLLRILRRTAHQEQGNPCILSCLYAAREFLDSDRDTDWFQNACTHTIQQHYRTAAANSNSNDTNTTTSGTNTDANDYQDSTNHQDNSKEKKKNKQSSNAIGHHHHPLIQKSTPEEIRNGIAEGLDIAQSVLLQSSSSLQEQQRYNSGGSYGASYTIGLVGKPSAGKSTFFNAATGFSRQRGQQQQRQQQQQHTTTMGDTTRNTINTTELTEVRIPETVLGGASMAAHPFTTIDPNIGYCLVPAPFGSCPEDGYCNADDGGAILRTKDYLSSFGSTHGRDPNGRRFIPVQLKDVAGLVPGAYQGKGRGNQFLNDLTDANVLIHVVDSSGSADASGNKIIIEEDDDDDNDDDDGMEQQQRTNPIDDLEWIRLELVKWICSNLVAKWDSIVRKKRRKIKGMFSGYGQSESMIDTILDALDIFLLNYGQHEQSDDRLSLDRIDLFSEMDVHRLVSLFLGVRFPMAMALNKYDIPGSKLFVKDIQKSLPIHGAYIATPLSAKKEMNFVKEHMLLSMKNQQQKQKQGQGQETAGITNEHKDTVNVTSTRIPGADNIKKNSSSPLGVWNCLSSAIELRLPVFVFPVQDIKTWEPMPAMTNKVAMPGNGGNQSLPNKGMIECIISSGGTPPSQWNTMESNYYSCYNNNTKKKNSNSRNNNESSKLRDVLLMKPGSTVEDVFLTLKRLGALSGEFVRAEACSGDPHGEKPKPVPKDDIMGFKNRIIKIMSNKRNQWQN